MPLPLRLAGFRGQFVDGLDDGLHFLVREQYCAQHLVFGQLFRFRLHHQDRVGGAGNDHVQLALGQLVVGGVEDIALGLVEADSGAADGTVEGRTGNGQRGGGADHGGNIGVDVFIGGHDGTHHLHLVHEAVGKQRADGAVDPA